METKMRPKFGFNSQVLRHLKYVHELMNTSRPGLINGFLTSLGIFSCSTELLSLTHRVGGIFSLLRYIRVFSSLETFVQ